MFRASLCPSSGEQECALPHMVFCTGCDGCGCVELGREHMVFCTGCDGCGCVELGREHMVFCTGCDGCECVELGCEHMVFCIGCDGCGCMELGRNHSIFSFTKENIEWDSESLFLKFPGEILQGHSRTQETDMNRGTPVYEAHTTGALISLVDSNIHI